MDHRRDILPHLIYREMHTYLASYLTSAGEQPALKVNDDHVRRLQQKFAHSRWRNQQSTLIEASRKISGCSRHEAEARQPFAEAHKLPPQLWLANWGASHHCSL